MAGHEMQPVQSGSTNIEALENVESLITSVDAKTTGIGKMVARLSNRDLEAVAEITIPGLV